MIKNIIMIIALAIFISSCSRLNPSSDQNDNINDPSTDNGNTDNGNTDDSLIEDDNKYPYLPIKLKAFEVEDKDSNGYNPTDEDHIRARKIDIKEKEYMLKHLDLIRFVINTPEFEAAIFDPDYKFRAGRTATGTYGTIGEGEYYDKTKLLALLKYASITTYFIKTDIGGDATALGKAGRPYYVDVDLLKNPSKGPWDTDAHILFPNRVDWADGEFGGYGQEFPDNIDIAAIMFHELMHNLGTKHGKAVHPEDTSEVMEDIFRATVNGAWRKKYGKQVKEYNYYQIKYKNFLTFTTTPTSR
jgi:hypothetical protein